MMYKHLLFDSISVNVSCILLSATMCHFFLINSWILLAEAISIDAQIKAVEVAPWMKVEGLRLSWSISGRKSKAVRVEVQIKTFRFIYLS